MATDISETIPTDPSAPRRRFEVQQSMKDAPLTTDPETGERVQRVITGGYGYVGSSKSDSASRAPAASPSHGGGCGHGACGCGHGH